MEKLLLSRIGDLLRAAQRGDTAASPFLTPEEAVRCDEYLKRNEPEAAYRLWGGYDDAERKRLFLLSAYSVFPEEDFRALLVKRRLYTQNSKEDKKTEQEACLPRLKIRLKFADLLSGLL